MRVSPFGRSIHAIPQSPFGDSSPVYGFCNPNHRFGQNLTFTKGSLGNRLLIYFMILFRQADSASVGRAVFVCTRTVPTLPRSPHTKTQEIALRAHFASPSPVAAPAANWAGIQIFLLYRKQAVSCKVKRLPHTKEPCLLFAYFSTTVTVRVAVVLRWNSSVKL